MCAHPLSSSAVRTTLTVAVMAAASAVVRAQNPNGQRPSPEINPPGAEMARGTATTKPSAEAAAPITPSTPAVKAVQDLLSKSVTGILAGHHGRDVMAVLAKADRDRIGDPPAGNWADVDAAAEAFQAAWRARYGSSFNLADKIPLAFTEPTMHVAGVGPTTGPAGDDAHAGRPGGQPVTVTLTGPARRTGVLLRVTHDGPADGDWHLDVADTTTATSLHDSLLRHLTAVTNDQKNWPTDVDQAYVYATQRLLASVGEPAAPR